MSTHPVLPPARFTMAAYLTFERAAAERHEFLDGQIYAMAGESEAHGILSANLLASFVVQLRGTPCRAFSKDMKVLCGSYRSHTREGLYAYPDLVIVCGTRQYHDQAQDVLLNPVVLVEVLSPSTEAFDRGEKFTRYSEWLPSLQHYLLVSQESPRIDQYSRTPGDQWALRHVQGLPAALSLPDQGVVLPLSEIYEGVEFPL